MATAGGAASSPRKEALMLKLFQQILVEYWQVLCFKRSPKDTPKSTMMVMIALALAFGAMTLEYFLARLMDVTHLSFATLCFSLLVQIGLITVYIRIVLRVHQNTSDFLPFFICWLMMMFFLDSISSLVMASIIGFQFLGITKILSISLLSMGMVLGIMLSLWQVTYLVYLLIHFLKLPFWQAFIYYLGWLLINYIYWWVLKTF